MDDTNGTDGEQDLDGADGWVPLTDMPHSIQRDLRSRIPLRRRRGMRRSMRWIDEGRQGTAGEGSGDRST